MGSGDPPGLQNRRAAGLPVAGVFDSHTLPPFIFNDLYRNEGSSQPEIRASKQFVVIKT